MKYLLIIISLLSYLAASNINITDTTVSNGRTTFIEFVKEKNTHFKSLSLGKKTFKVFTNPVDDKKAYALIPFSYYEKLGAKKMKLNFKEDGVNKSKAFVLKIVDGKYKKEEIKVSSSKVNPKSKEVKKRISKEYAEAMKIYGTVTKESYINSKFILPLNSFITSDFGKARVYNGSLKGYHSGTDFRAKVG